LIADGDTLSRLAAMAQSGDKQAYATLLESAQSWLRRFFARRIVPHHLDDLVQDTLLSIHRKLASYDPDRPFLPWLAAIARYRWIDHLRKIYAADEVEFDEDIAATNEEPAIAARISIERLMSFLPASQAKAINLVKIDGLSVVEASLVCGQSESLVKVNIHRGLKRLTALIEKA
jgi:RNA polymerase sigma-70 factor (ECF subfamily)